MGLPRYAIYKYCRTVKGWGYCKPAWGKNNKLKPNVVLMDGKEETHPEGMYYLNVSGQWEKAGTTAVEAQEAQRRRLARQQYERQTGEKLPETPNGTPLARGGTPRRSFPQRSVPALPRQGGVAGGRRRPRF